MFVIALGAAATLRSASGQEHSVSQALGLQFIHGGMSELRYVRPHDPLFVAARETLRRSRSEHFLWSDRPWREFEGVAGVSCEELDSLTIARPWAFAGVRPFLVVGRSRRIERQHDSGNATRQEIRFLDSSYTRSHNDLAYGFPTPETLLFGTEGDVRVSLSRTRQLKLADTVPDWTDFDDPQMFSLRTGPETEMLTSTATGVRFLKDGFTIRTVRAYRNDTSTEWMDESLALSFERDFDRSPVVIGNNALKSDQVSHSIQRDGFQLIQQITVQNLSSDLDWRKAAHLLRPLLLEMKFLDMNHVDTQTAADALAANNTLLHDSGIDAKARQHAESISMSAIRTLGKLMSRTDADSLERAYLHPGSDAISDQIRLSLVQSFSPHAVNLHDRISAVGDRHLGPIPTRVLEYFVLYGDRDATIAASRTVARQRAAEAIDSLRQVARDPRRDRSARAAANQALIDLGVPSYSSVDMRALTFAKPLISEQKENTRGSRVPPMSTKEPVAGDLDGGMSVTAAVAIARSGKAERLRNALDFLDRVPVAESQRSAVIDAVVPLISHGDVGTITRRIVVRWMDASSVTRLLAAFVHHQEQLRVENLHQILFELKMTGRAQVISIIDAIAPLGDLHGESVQTELFQIVAAEGIGYEDLPAIFRHLETPRNDRRSYFDAMVKSGDPSIIPVLVQGVCEPGRQLAAESEAALILIGPVAERIVGQALLRTSVGRESLCRTLGQIGSRRSVATLNRLVETLGASRTRDMNLRREAEQAIKRIKSQDRVPVDITDLQVRKGHTRRSIDLANKIIAHHVASHGTIPNRTDGRRLIALVRDGWGRRLNYLPKSETKFEIRSAGRDGQGMNDDDIVDNSTSHAIDPRIQPASIVSGQPSSKRQPPSRVAEEMKQSANGKQQNLSRKAEQYLRDLRDSDASVSAQQAALHFLSRLELPKSNRAEVFSTVSPFVASERSTLSVNALRILSKLGFQEDDVPTLIAAFDSRPREIAAEFAKLPTAEVREFLKARLAGVNKITDPVFRTLETIGSPVEEAAWAGLVHSDPIVRRMTINMLAKIGTEKSVTRLRQETSLPASAVDHAILQIESRNGKTGK